MKDSTLCKGAVIVILLVGVLKGAIWYVHSDSTLNSVQAGIDSCSTGDTVLVGPGTYTENINFNGMAITVKSELGPDSTIIDGGNPFHPDSGSVVLFANGEDTTSVLKGFTITNGSGTNFTFGTIGGGILCFGSSSPTITGNRITLNEAFWGGGGIASLFSSPVIDSNTIDNNVVDSVGGGIFILDDSDATITNNCIKINAAVYGGGICITGTGAAPMIMNNDIAENNAIGSGGYGSGGGVAVGWSAAPYFQGNTICNNTATYGGGGIYCYTNSTPLFIGETITQNNASNGAIRCRYNPAPHFKLCNISANNSSGASILECALTFDSCTISNNNYDGIVCNGGVDAVLNWCNIYGHSGYGINNTYATDTVDAENCWWGDSSGPYHAALNPTGSGDSVSDFVDFSPWLIDSVQCVGIEEEPSTESAPMNQVYIGATIFRGPLRLPKGKKCKVFDIAGRIVRPERIRPGIYFVEVDGHLTQKVIMVK